MKPRVSDPEPRDLPTVSIGSAIDEIRDRGLDKLTALDLPRKENGKRRYLTWATLWRVKQRDGFRCVRCGAGEKPGARNHLEVDHIVPVSMNGPDRIENLQTLCRSCNHEKGGHFEWLG